MASVSACSARRTSVRLFQDVQPRGRVAIVDPAFALPLPDLATSGIDHWPAEPLRDRSVVGQRAAIRPPVAVLLAVILVEEPARIQALGVSLALEHHRLDAMPAPATGQASVPGCVVERLVQRGRRTDGNALAPVLAQDERQIARVDPPLQARVVDAQQLRRHRAAEDIAELTLQLAADGRDVAIVGMGALGAAQTQDPAEQLGIALDHTHDAELILPRCKTATFAFFLRFCWAEGRGGRLRSHPTSSSSAAATGRGSSTAS